MSKTILLLITVLLLSNSVVSQLCMSDGMGGFFVDSACISCDAIGDCTGCNDPTKELSADGLSCVTCDPANAGAVCDKCGADNVCETSTCDDSRF